MTLTRKLALKISDSVVRYASPGCKEWAEGLAREVTFIESDWTALAWALGSTRILLHYREAPIGSLDDVPSSALKFVEATRTGALILLMPMLQSPVSLWEFFETRCWLARAGCAVAVFCSISAGIFLLMERRRLKNPSDNIYDDIVACTLYYKAELERRCSTLPISISLVFGYVVSVMLPMRVSIRVDAIFGAVMALLALETALVLVCVRRSYRRQMERLDTLLAERL